MSKQDIAYAIASEMKELLLHDPDGLVLDAIIDIIEEFMPDDCIDRTPEAYKEMFRNIRCDDIGEKVGRFYGLLIARVLKYERIIDDYFEGESIL